MKYSKPTMQVTCSVCGEERTVERSARPPKMCKTCHFKSAASRFNGGPKSTVWKKREQGSRL